MLCSGLRSTWEAGLLAVRRLVAAVHTTAGAVAPDGITVWEVASGRRLARFPIARGPDGCRCGFLPGGNLLVTVFGLMEAPSVFSVAWDLASDPARPQILGRFDGMPAARMDWNGGDLLTLESRATATLRDPRTTKTVRAFVTDGPDQRISAATCTTGSEIVAAVSGPPWRLAVWNGKTGQRLSDFTTVPDVARLAISPDGAILAAVDIRHNVYLIDRKTGTARRIVSEKIHHPRLPMVAFSPGGTRLAIALASHSEEADPAPISLWDTCTRRMLSTLTGWGEEPENMIFTPDGRSLLISSRSSVRLWRLAGGDCDADNQPDGHRDETWSVAFSPDGRVVATGSDDSEADSTIKLWDPATGRLIRSWAGGEGTVSSLAFAPAAGHSPRGTWRRRETFGSGTRRPAACWRPSTGTPTGSAPWPSHRTVGCWLRPARMAPSGSGMSKPGANGTYYPTTPIPSTRSPSRPMDRRLPRAATRGKSTSGKCDQTAARTGIVPCTIGQV